MDVALTRPDGGQVSLQLRALQVLPRKSLAAQDAEKGGRAVGVNRSGAKTGRTGD